MGNIDGLKSSIMYCNIEKKIKYDPKGGGIRK